VAFAGLALPRATGILAPHLRRPGAADMHAADPMLDRIPEFVSNHPLLFAALAATIAMIVFSEVQRLRRVAQAVSPSRATRLSNSEDAVFVDTRAKKDYDQGHLPGARHIPAREAEQYVKQIQKLRDRPIVLYDDGGFDAERAAKALAKNGFAQLYSLQGGIAAWRKADLPIETQGKH